MSRDKEAKLQTYQLYIACSQDIKIQVGRLGQFVFPAGLYIYTGSAKRNMDSRLQRHLLKDKKRFWHIDYLLSDPHTEIINIVKFAEQECAVNTTTDGRSIVPGFGASDCHAGCKSHLKYRSQIIRK